MMEINGRQVRADDLRALALTNYGSFTSMRVEQGWVRGLSLHMDRLSRDAAVLFGADLDIQRVRHLVRGYVERTGSPAVVRVTVFDAGGGIEHPGGTQDPDILVSARHAPGAPIPPLRVESVHYERELPAVKHVGLFGSLALRRAAQQKGLDDVLFVDQHSHVTEGATWNVGFFDGSQVIWPKADVLAGVTLRLVKGVLVGSGITSVENVVHISQVSETWAAFATNASVGVRPIQAIDGVELLDNSPVIRKLQLQYARIPGEPL